MMSHSFLFGGCAGAFAATSNIVTNFSTNGMVGSMAGGLAAGAVLGAHSGRFGTGVASGIVFGLAAVACDLSGGSLTQGGERERNRARSFNPVPTQQ